LSGTDENRIDDCPADQKFIYLMQVRLAPFARTVDRIAEFTGVNSIGRGMDRLLQGDIGGGLELAMAIPLIPGERVLLSEGKIGSSVVKVLGIGRRE
jgi:hypothetical protein